MNWSSFARPSFLCLSSAWSVEAATCTCITCLLHEFLTFRTCISCVSSTTHSSRMSTMRLTFNHWLRYSFVFSLHFSFSFSLLNLRNFMCIFTGFVCVWFPSQWDFLCSLLWTGGEYLLPWRGWSSCVLSYIFPGKRNYSPSFPSPPLLSPLSQDGPEFRSVVFNNTVSIVEVEESFDAETWDSSSPTNSLVLVMID